METNSQDEYQTFTLWNDMRNIGDVTSAIIMDGQYFIPANTKTVLFPESETQYFINSTGDILFNTEDNSIFHDNEGFQLINNTNNEEVEDQNQIVFYTNNTTDIKEEISVESDPTAIDRIEPSINESEAEAECFDLNSLLDISGGNEIVDNESNGFQYIVELPSFNSLENIEDCKMDNIFDHAYTMSDYDASVPVDISKITGKNLLTGQTVTLDSYLEKVKNSTKELSLLKTNEISKNVKKKNEHTILSNLLNKKLTIGKTLNGQRLIGKVIHVGKKEYDEEPAVIETDQELIEGPEINVLDESCIDLTASYYDTVENHVPNSVIIEDNQNQDENILLENINDLLISTKTEDVFDTEQIEYPSIEQEQTTDKDNDQVMLDYVSKTMANLMNMEAVLKKLKRKNLLIKVTEKVIDDDRKSINTLQIGGHLEMLGGWQKHEYEEKWVFKLDTEKRGDEIEEWIDLGSQKFHETIKLTITVVKVDGLVQSTKVNLNYNVEKCSMCNKEFRSVYKLKTHLKLTHDVDYQYCCQICDRTLENKETYDLHRKYHVEMGELFPCEECDKHFLSLQKLTKHMCTHSLDVLKLTCTVCGYAFDKISAWKEHMLKHDETNRSSKTINNKLRSSYMTSDTNTHCKDVKNCYVCKVCNRIFSRYSNLQRHSEIHGTKNSIALYSCSMCGCTYNYMSSLTRHIVQNHISST